MEEVIDVDDSEPIARRKIKRKIEEMEEQCVQLFKFQSQMLRISASDVSGMTGFNPWKSMPELALKLVYQGSVGAALMRQDAELLGLQIVSEEEQLLQLASKASKKTETALKKALDVKKGTMSLKDVNQVQKLKQEVIEEAKKTQKLNTEELKVLQEGAFSAVNTGFGIEHEDRALDAYEEKCGWKVSERNLEVRAWPFVRKDNGQIEALSPAASGFDEESEHIPHYFAIRGSIDGIREEVASMDDDDLTFRRVVVECKHRVNRIHKIPPIYEQIQTTVYCKMYDADHADIVQVLRPKIESPRKPTALDNWISTASPDKANSKKTKETDKVEALPSAKPVIQVNRISMNDSLYKHKENWDRIVLPRLVSFVDAVYAIRRDDSKRYRLLVSSCTPTMDDGWDLLTLECPWIRECSFKSRH